MDPHDKIHDLQHSIWSDTTKGFNNYLYLLVDIMINYYLTAHIAKLF